MKRVLIITLCALALCSFSASAQKLVIIHTNDTHSHLDPLRDGRGGVVERAAYIDRARKDYGRRKVLLLHAGDFNQGTSYFTLLNGDLEVSLVNALKYDCITLGNHEFDNGIEDLARRLKTVKCPVVCCNYDFSPFELGDYITPYTIIRRGGMKIGIVGALCDISSVVARTISDRIPALDTEKEVNKWAAFLKDEKKCDMVILLSHMGFDGPQSDVEISSKLHNVDLIVGGHSHTNLDDIVWKTDADGKPVGIITDGEWGLNLGQIEIY
jgi:5'-nucleotidase